MRLKSQFILSISLGVLLIAGCASVKEKQSLNVNQKIEKGYLRFQSQEAKENVLNEEALLKDYLKYAALNNGELEAAFNQWKAALKKIPQARALPNPQVSFAYYIEEVETRVGPQEFAIGGAQTFPWLMKLILRGDVAAKEALVAQQQYEDTKLKLFYEVKEVYYELYYLSRSIQVTQENIQLLTYFEKVAQIKYRAAIGSHPDVIKVQVELGKLEDQLKTLQDLKGPTIAKFNAALNRPIFSLIPWPKKIEEKSFDLADKDLLDELLQSSPKLKALRYEVEKQEKGVGLAKQSFFPDITLGADYIDTGSAIAETPESGKDPIFFKIKASVPIWFDKNIAEVKEAKAREQAAIKSLQDKESELASEMKMAFYQFEDSKRKINLYRDSLIPKAEQSLKATQKAFEAGMQDFLSLIDAQRILLEFSLSYERALTDHAQHLAELEMILGREFEQGEEVK